MMKEKDWAPVHFDSPCKQGRQWRDRCGTHFVGNVEFCCSCGGYVDSVVDEASVAASREKARADAAARGAIGADLPITTLQEIPGRPIAALLAMVVGIGHPGTINLGTTGGRSQAAYEDAYRDLARRARELGADAVVGVTLGVYSGGNRSANQAIGVQLLGTAVALMPSGEGTADTPESRFVLAPSQPALSPARQAKPGDAPPQPSHPTRSALPVCAACGQSYNKNIADTCPGCGAPAR